jgi:hypothetical protein
MLDVRLQCPSILEGSGDLGGDLDRVVNVTDRLYHVQGDADLILNLLDR